jgi:hypothetical protein
MRPFFLVLALYVATTKLCLADEAERQAASFARIYNSYCVRHIDDLDVFKGQLESIPQLAPAGAELFLNGQTGGVWPVPDMEGLFVLALPEDPDLCVVYARRAGAAKAEELFIELLSAPAAPFLVRKTGDQFVETPKNGTTHIISYEWYTEDSSRKIEFILSTSGLETAELQVAGSVAVITE